MSLQSMFNATLGNVGVQTSILKNRLKDTNEPEVKPTEKPQNASKIDSAGKSNNDTNKAVEGQEEASKGLKRQNIKDNPEYIKEYKSYQRLVKRIDTLKSQQQEYKARIKELKKREEDFRKTTMEALWDSQGGVL